MKITAAVVRASAQPFTLEELELDEPHDDEVLVRIIATGLCHTDLAMCAVPVMPFPLVLGHEGAGVVERVGSQVTRVQPGDHVVLSFFTCAVCENCRKGNAAYCDRFLDQFFPGIYTGARPDGSHFFHRGDEPVSGGFFSQSSFGTYALARERNTIKVPGDLPIELLGPLGCGIQTGAGAVMNSLRATAGSSIVIFGVGSVGLSAIMAARAVGCTTIIGVDLKSQRLQLARELGATHTINPAETDPVEEIRRITGRGAHYSLEVTGVPSVLRQAVDCLRMTGVCGLIGVSPPGAQVSLEMASILNGRTIRGIIEGDSVPEIFIPHLIDLYRQGRFPLDRLVTFYTLDQINQAVEDTEHGNVVKAIVRMP